MFASNSLKRPLKIGIVVFVTTLLTACSSVKLAYNYAPNLIAYRVNGYLNLDETQQALLDQELVTFTAWHEENALPQYTKMLNQWATRVASDQPFQAQEILTIQEAVEQQLQKMGTRASQQLGPLMVTLGPQQIRQLQSKFETSNKEYVADYLKNAESPSHVKKRHARVLKRFQDWLGPLSATQQKILTDVSDARAPVLLAWETERQLRQRALLSLLNGQLGADPIQAQASLQHYLASLNQYREPSLGAQRDQLRMEWAQATAEILNSASPAQRKFLQNKLRGYAQDFAALTPKHVAQKL